MKNMKNDLVQKEKEKWKLDLLKGKKFVLASFSSIKIEKNMNDEQGEREKEKNWTTLMTPFNNVWWVHNIDILHIDFFAFSIALVVLFYKIQLVIFHWTFFATPLATVTFFFSFHSVVFYGFEFRLFLGCS